MIYGEHLYHVSTFIGDKMNHEWKFLYHHTTHGSVTYSIARRVVSQGIDLDYYLFLVSLRQGLVHCTNRLLLDILKGITVNLDFVFRHYQGLSFLEASSQSNILS